MKGLEVMEVPGSYLRLETVPLEFAKAVLHVLSLDAAVSDEVILLRRDVLGKLRTAEFALVRPRARWVRWRHAASRRRSLTIGTPSCLWCCPTSCARMRRAAGAATWTCAAMRRCTSRKTATPRHARGGAATAMSRA